MKISDIIKIAVVLACAAASAKGATVTLQMSSGLVNAVNFANSAGVAQSGLTWGIIVDTGANGVNYSNLVGTTLSTSTNGIRLGTSDDYIFISTNLSATLPNIPAFGNEAGATGQLSDISGIITGVPGTNPVAASQTFTLIWFNAGISQTATLQAGNQYGIVNNSLFIIPAGGATQDYSAVFSANPDPVRSASLTLVPEPSVALLGAIGGLALLRRRRN